jgi:radical SAM protein (TIGR04043 family)
MVEAPEDAASDLTEPTDITGVAELIMDLQAVGLRIDTELETTRRGGAGPSDSGMLWIEGVPVTVPPSSTSPYRLRADDDGQSIYRDGVKLASVSGTSRPRFYDLTTAEGIPYHQIALLHLDSLASTVVQVCNYWGNSDQCGFCGIEVSLDAGRTIAKKTPEMLAEVAVAAKELDGAVDATLTTGSSAAPDRGALYVSRCGRAVKEAAGLPVEVQFEPPRRLEILDQVHDTGVDSVGIHVETFDPAVLQRIAPGKFRTGIETYFRTWERAVELFGEGRSPPTSSSAWERTRSSPSRCASVRWTSGCTPSSCRSGRSPARSWRTCLRRRVSTRSRSTARSPRSSANGGSGRTPPSRVAPDVRHVPP